MKKIVLYTAMLIGCLATAKAESILEKEILFKNISNSEGLSHSTVFTINQDSVGYMWFGTQDGLNRYDGSEFKVYRPDAGEKSIASNYIRSLLMDSSGKLWIGGDRGVSVYNYMDDSFVNYKLFEAHVDRYVTVIDHDRSGNIWVGTVNGELYRFNRENNSFEQIKIASGKDKLYQINSISQLGNDLLIGSEYGLFLLDVDKYSLRAIEYNEKALEVRAIVLDKKGGFWVGTEGDGMLNLNTQLQFDEQLQHDKFNENSLSNNNVRSLEWDDEGNLWIGTFVGLSIYNPDKKTFSNHYQEFGRTYALSQNSIRSIYRDKQGGMWLGTFFGGVDYYHPANIKFDLLNQNGGEFSLNDNVISAIKEDKKGNFWIATNDKGLNYWDREKNKFLYFEHNEKDPRSLSSNNLKSILVVNDNYLLVGTHKSGLNYFNTKSGKSQVFKADGNPGSISSNGVYALLKDHQGTIWVGTWKGLNSFNLKTKKFSSYYLDSKGNRLSSDRISFLMEDSMNRIWIGTFEGLNIFNPQKNLFESFKKNPDSEKSLSNDVINCIHEDSKGRIWVGTRNGLNLFDELNREFVHYNTRDGLPNDAIYGVMEDDKGCLWISSNGGLSCFNPADKSVKNYTPSDGIQGMQFNNYSFCKASDGKFLFGGIRGITIFNPQNIIKTPFNPEVIITRFKLFNQWIKAGDKTKILDKHISETSEITLKSRQNTILLSYTSLNFIAPQKIHYQHMLEGFDLDWQTPTALKSAGYSNLKPGNYIFKVKAFSSEGDASEMVTQLNINILPPWWLTVWAFSAYFLFLSLIIWASMRFIKERLKTQNELRIERLEKQKLSEINQMKLQFFTNITHEFRTPLTLILSPLQKLRERKFDDEWTSKQHHLIYKNTQRLLHLVDQLMDFRKSEMGGLKLRVAEGEIVSFVNEIYLSFAGVASQNNIVYTFETKVERMNILFDESYIEKIVFNLLSNAFKFTPSRGYIGIQLKQLDKNISIEVSDSGKGIPADKQSLIFERFYRINENTSRPGAGIGLALTKRLVDLHHGTIKIDSEEGKGSTFIVNIPISNDEYSPDEIIVKKLPEDGELKIKPEIDVNVELNTAEEQEVEIVGLEAHDSVLIVEDNPDIIEYLKENLSEHYSIKSAKNGEEALAIVSEHQPSLIISDVMMPVMDGISFCKKIKQNIKTCHIPVILLTAKSSIENQIEGLDMGADDYVSKPFVMNLLEAKISNIIKTRKRLKEIYSQTLDIQPDKIAFNSLDQDLLQKAVEIVEANLTEPDLSVDSFAREMGMSRSNLHLKLKAITGESATDFIKKMKFKKATQLIEENKHSIAEISYMVGFNSPSYFSTSFKKYFGYLPTEYLLKNYDTKY